MRTEPVRISVSRGEEESWDTIWKWSWFTRELWVSELWKEEEIALQPLSPLLREFQAHSILDCSCGLGFKTVLLARMGYEVEGSDASAIAIDYAPELARDEGVDIKFFRSRYEDLGKKCRREYDCVYSDNFDEIETAKTLAASARGIHSVLREGGRFIFCGALPRWSRSDSQKRIEKEWEKRKKFDMLPPCEKDGLRVTSLEVDEKTPEGILENRIFLIEEEGVMRAEVAFMMNPRIKWTFRDYVGVLKEAGFRKVNCIEKGGQVFNIARK